ncbi:Hsp20 family protein [Halorubrum ezzemoulense]|uniref:HSP20 family protein n=1 Tax=Halorubrum ezzemoulense TaxID=337243 RepID=A0A238V9E4_HALEZ|nr:MULTISPECIES: Hsp20 family protein [Halorubrum]MDB2223946.1 Hsp20 family protein [Halorubrum ezzemoulense]MDB2236270.1 Hsp20 family protein [Halorubrum ezzemoulense]MDB2248442.1 Hsp20 family protein [Halorubrum ezzemoulense]MDB2275245.1 Hsp20 family protein [Halorubrum ezzemoulense]MDB9250286.1 Hsp20 family protein [Halorubrum ezzemoulense]
MTRRDPFDEIEELFERMGREFEELGGTLEGTGPEVPRFPGARDVDVDVVEDDEAITVVADLPGFDADDVDVELRDDALVISGSREESSEFDIAEEDGADDPDDGESGPADVRYHRRERRRSSVSRRVPIPEPVEADAAAASFDAGVLTVTLPKRSPDDDRGHTIDVS